VVADLAASQLLAPFIGADAARIGGQQSL